MSRHLLRVLLALYPRAWRDRYGAELAGLTEDLISAGEIRPLSAVVNLAGGAALEWGRVMAGSGTSSARLPWRAWSRVSCSPRCIRRC